jgi:hypothetical protein
LTVNSYELIDVDGDVYQIVDLIYRYMKWIKVFESFESLESSDFESLSESSIESICKKFGITNWTQNSDGLINVDGDVYLRDKGLTKLPLNFGRVTGHFNCYQNNLTTLKGAPKEVGGDFWCCRNNQLTTLEGGPSRVGGDFWCNNNQLTTLEGGPKEVGGNFNCSVNELTTLKGAPIRVGGNFDCHKNNLTSLEGAPENIDYYFNCKFNDLISLEGLPIVDDDQLYFEENPIWEVYKLFPNMKSYLDSLDYGYLRGNSIDKRRFGEALDELGIKIPESIPGWKYI